MVLKSKYAFLLKNILTGLLWFAVLFVIYYYVKKFLVAHAPDDFIEQYKSKSGILYLIYFLSEFFFGIIPPELFMIWAVNKGSVWFYVLNVLFFASLSYVIGYVTFIIGSLIYKRVFFRYLRSRFFKSTWPQINRYGLFLIIVAALTPLPWSTVCLLVGSAGYPHKKFLFYALFRLLRFAVYGFIIFQTH